MTFTPTNCLNLRNMPGPYCQECGVGRCLYDREQLREYIEGARETVDLAKPQQGEAA